MTDMPKRPMKAFMLWLNSSREQIRSENPGLKVTELAKKGGEIWRALDKSVWEEKAAKAMEQYERDMKLYYAQRDGGDGSKKGKKGTQTKTTKKEVSAYEDGEEEDLSY